MGNEGMTPEAISEFAAELGIEDAQLVRLHREYIVKRGDEADAKLFLWLRTEWRRLRDQPRFLARQDGLLHPPQYSSSAVTAIDDAECPPPDEIAGYRKSREARDNHQAERMAEIADLMDALRTLRTSIDALPVGKKTRTFWRLKGQIDATEREILRRAAA